MWTVDSDSKELPRRPNTISSIASNYFMALIASWSLLLDRVLDIIFVKCYLDWKDVFSDVCLFIRMNIHVHDTKVK